MTSKKWVMKNLEAYFINLNGIAAENLYNHVYKWLRVYYKLYKW